MIKLYFAIALTFSVCVSAVPASAQVSLVEAARERVGKTLIYDPRYVPLSYPGGDVPEERGVCSDVIIRSYRSAYNYDFQQSVHEDIASAFGTYPANWGLTKPDKHIDHRRVPNLEAYLVRQGAQIDMGSHGDDFHAGDVVTWRVGGRLPHIGIISDWRSQSGTPLVIHNMGWGTQEEDILFAFPRVMHFRFHPRATTVSSD